MKINNLSVRDYNKKVKPEYSLSRTEFNNSYGYECEEHDGIEIPSMLTKSGNPEQMWVKVGGTR